MIDYAAANSPNVRIYKNIPLLLQTALLMSHFATPIDSQSVQYNTSQSYAGLNDLFRVRWLPTATMLETYVDDSVGLLRI